MGYFSDTYSELQYPIDSESELGLYNAQLGAIHAIGAFLTLNKKHSGIVVMPTGSGKSSVIMMSPYLASSKKVLIVTPSKMVRGQINKDFCKLNTLIKINVFNLFTKLPNIFEMKKLYSDNMFHNVQSNDVIIATPQCALSISENIIKMSFDLVIIDEAHHIPAPKWQNILANMKHAKHFLFTATPFRFDKKEIKGEIIYNYPLSMAYNDGIFGDIQYIPIDESHNKDLLIAKEAEKLFINDKQSGYNHKLMVRTDTNKKAKILKALYSKETQLRLERVDCSMPFKIVENIINKLKSGDIDGIICVNMLGEGFDFPNLKIAAIHSPHKSLANILQFIGRFARTNSDDIGTAKFIAMKDEELVIENNRLFTSDAIWQKMIIDMSEHHIQHQEEIKSNLLDFQRDDDSTSEENISLFGLRPNCHAKVFRITDFNINGKFPDSCCIDSNIYRNNYNNTIIAIGNKIERPKWTTSEQINDINNFLYIIHYQKETSLLFIYSQIKTDIDYQEIAEAFSSGFEKIIRTEMHRVLAEMDSFELFNTGMQSRSSDRGESYRIMAGSNVASSIDPITGRMFSPGHVFCKAISNDGMELTIGYSSGSKIWSSKYLFIPEYINWCNSCGFKIVNELLTVKTNTNLDNLPMPVQLGKYPERVIYCFFSNKTLSSPPIITNLNGELTNYLIIDTKIIIIDQQENYLLLKISIDDMKDIVKCDINGNYSCSNPTIFLKNGRNLLTISNYLCSYPLTYKASDGTIITGNELLESNNDIQILSNELIIPINWKNYNTDIYCEFGKTKKKNMLSIHDALQNILNDNKDFDILLYDHGSGEIADYITIKENTENINISLYHIKSMRGSNYNSNVSDIYEVCQQGTKSLMWLKSRFIFLNKIKKRQRSNNCKVVHGKNNEIDTILKKNKQLYTKIIIVQPGVSKKQNIPEKYQEILAAANMYIKNNGLNTEFFIWGSE